MDPIKRKVRRTSKNFVDVPQEKPRRSAARVMRWLSATWMVGAIRSAGAQGVAPSPSLPHQPIGARITPATTPPAKLGPAPNVANAPKLVAGTRFSDSDGSYGLLDGDALVAAPSNISLFGATGQPQPSDVVGHFYYGNSFFNAMLTALAKGSPDVLKASVQQTPGQPAGQYIVTLSHQGERVEVPVDDQFYRSTIGSITNGFEGNACGFHLGVDALWPALFEKAFGRLSLTFAENFYPGDIIAGFGGDPRFGHRVIDAVTPQAAVGVASIAPVQTYQLSQRDDYASFLNHRGAIREKTQVGLLTFLAGSAWSDSAAASGSFRNNLDFPSGNYCFLSTSNGFYVADCTLAGGANVTVLERGAYILEPGVSSPRSLKVRENQVAFPEDNIEGGGSHFVLYESPLFSVPLSLARELNATVFLTGPGSQTIAEPPLSTPATTPAGDREQPPTGADTAPSQTSGARLGRSYWSLPILLASGYAQQMMMRNVR